MDTSENILEEFDIFLKKTSMVIQPNYPSKDVGGVGGTPSNIETAPVISGAPAPREGNFPKPSNNATVGKSTAATTTGASAPAPAKPIKATKL
jgi:hypothetical protein